MNRTLLVLLSMVMLVATAAPAMAVAPDATQATDDDVLAAAETTTEATETTDNETPPGAMLAGSIGVHEAEMKGAIEHRAFGIQIRNATNESKAQVLNLTQERLHDRQTSLEERKDRLDTARDNGTISESQYRAQVAVIAAESAQVQTMANSTERTAQGLPAETLEANGVNVTAIHQIRERSQQMTGPEVAEIARQIAGNNVGSPMGPPENVPGPQSGPHGGMDDGQDRGMNATTQSGNGQGGMPTDTTDTTTSGETVNETDDSSTSETTTTTAPTTNATTSSNGGA